MLSKAIWTTHSIEFLQEHSSLFGLVNFHAPVFIKVVCSVYFLYLVLLTLMFDMSFLILFLSFPLPSFFFFFLFFGNTSLSGTSLVSL